MDSTLAQVVRVYREQGELAALQTSAEAGLRIDTLRQAAGDLPQNLTTQNFGCASINGDDEEHGTGVAEIVHEMAPAAQLDLICAATILNLAQAKDYVKASA